MNYLEASALISPCGLYRYTLTRVWDAALAPLVFCMLNPSTADGESDDATIRRCVGFARTFGFGSLVVVNLFAFRATDPRALLTAADPVGPDNDYWIAAQTAGRNVVAAWGGLPKKLAGRAREVRELIGSNALVQCLGLTQSGEPRHPVRLAKAAKPAPFPGRVA